MCVCELHQQSPGLGGQDSLHYTYMRVIHGKQQEALLKSEVKKRVSIKSFNFGVGVKLIFHALKGKKKLIRVLITERAGSSSNFSITHKRYL